MKDKEKQRKLREGKATERKRKVDQEGRDKKEKEIRRIRTRRE